ncbi:MAG: transposase [Candidatus Omnitrophica bacterium]|nr:transposase [Candidatus Omnitrophota bacterium]
MARKRCSEEQIIQVLKQAEAGKKVVDVCRENGIDKISFFS